MPTVRKKTKRGRQPSYSEKTLLKLIQQHLLNDHPNPKRTGCPPETVLEELARTPRQVNSSVVDHLFHCSPCYKALRPMLRARKAELRRTRTTEIPKKNSRNS